MAKKDVIMAKKDGNQAVAKKAPASWTPGKEEIFIDEYTKQINDTASPKGLNSASWSKVVGAYNTKAKDKLDSQQLQNKLKDLKEKYLELKKLSEISGAGFDSNRGKLMVIDDQWWDDRKANKGHKHLNQFRHKDFPLFSKLDTLFSTNTATGEFATASTSFRDAAKNDNVDEDDIRSEDDNDDVAAVNNALLQKQILKTKLKAKQRGRDGDNDDDDLLQTPPKKRQHITQETGAILNSIASLTKAVNSDPDREQFRLAVADLARLKELPDTPEWSVRDMVTVKSALQDSCLLFNSFDGDEEKLWWINDKLGN